MKKLIIAFILFFSWVSLTFASAAGCEFNTSNKNSSMSDLLKNCKPDQAVDVKNNAQIKKDWGFNNLIISLTKNIMTLIWILSIGSLAYGGLMMTFSWGSDEKIENAKKIFSWDRKSVV